MTDQQDVIVTADAHAAFSERALAAVSVPKSDAAVIADSLLEADLRGVYSHGIQLLHRYVRGLQNGINPTPEVTTVADAGGLAVLDGGGGMGQVVSVQAMSLAIERARSHGVATVVARNSNHMGALAYYGMMAVQQGMIGVCSTNGPAIMAPWGGVTETVSNNPFCVAAPAGESYPVVLDMASSTAARNKIRVAAAKGESIPPDWALDRQGRPTTDAEEALLGLVAPMAGAKGFALTVALEVLTSVIGGGLTGKDVPRDALASTDVFYPVKVSHYFYAIDVGKVMPLDEFKERVDSLARQVHDSALAEGTEAVYMPGEIEFLTRERRLAEGIPIPQTVMSTIDRIAAEVSVETIQR
jgi:LDH2 family malate/lactate/ureidoglycolate dehydrogenase